MATEIERKFLVSGTEDWESICRTRTPIVQGYLATDRERSVRIRTSGEEARLTIKGETRHGARPEFEYDVPTGEAEEILELCKKPLVEKVRYVVDHAGHAFEVDVFSGVNQGLITAEVELQRLDEPVSLPDWIGEEVTDDPRYLNANLVDHPYSMWTDRTAPGPPQNQRSAVANSTELPPGSRK